MKYYYDYQTVYLPNDMKCYYVPDANKLYLEENIDSPILVLIKKRNTYQDTDLEMRAMFDLSPTGFMLYCFLSSKPRNHVWCVYDDSLPFDRKTRGAAFAELYEKGYLEDAIIHLRNEDNELVDTVGYEFYELPRKT